MSINDELCDSSAADLLTNLRKEERLTPNICLELEARQNSEIPIFVKLQIDDKFRKCLISKNLQCSEIVEFLDALLTHIRKAPVVSREFTKLICAYLCAVKSLASKITLEKTYYDRVRRILVLYCILELSMVTCFDDDSTLASDIFIKIKLLMQGSNVVTVMDVFIDIDEEIRSIRSIRSSSIMKIVHRKYLSKSLIGGPIELDDTNFIKNLICFHLWFKAESVSKRSNVLKMFLSTIKPTLRLRSNPIYAPYLHSYNDDEVDDYKKLLQQPFDQKSLVIALRQLEMNTEWQHEIQETIFLDLTSDETIVKSEVVVALNLPDLIINVDDDEDELEINYLSSLYERMNDIKEGKSRLMLRNNDPIDMIEINDSDSDCDVESVIEIPKFSSSINENGRQNGAVSERESPDSIVPSQTSITHPSSRSNLKTFSRKMTVWLPSGPEFGRKLQPILRCRSFTTIPLSKAKKVTFRDPPVTATYTFIRRDYDESTNSNSIESTQETSSNITESPSHSDSSSAYIVTGPKCNFPYLSATVARSTSLISVSENDDVNVQHVSSKIKRGKSKKGRSRNTYRNQRQSTSEHTSIDSWIKRKEIHTNTDRIKSMVHKRAKETSSLTAVKENVQQISLAQRLLTCKSCSISLKRCDTNLAQQVKRVRVDVDLRKQQLCDVRNNVISTKSVFAKRKSSRQLDAATSKSKFVIEKIKRKSNNQKRKSKVSSVVRNRPTEVITRSNMYLKSQMKVCFISLKKMTNNVVQTTTTSSQNSQKLSYNSIINSTNHADSICRLPTKSPQEYQFKRSFEKMPANEFTQISSPIKPSTTITVEKTSNPSEPLVPYDQLKPPLQTLLPAFQFMDNEFECPRIVGSDLINQSLNIVSEVESSDQTIQLPNQTSDVRRSTFELIQNEIVATSDQQLNRSITNYSPDTTTSSIPQYYAISDTNSPSNEITTNVINPMNIAKQLGMLNDDNDIPSPVYSPYAGKRKRCKKQKSSNPQIMNDSMISIVTVVNDKMTVNGVMCNGNDDNVDSTQFAHNRNVSIDVAPNDVLKGDESSAIVEIEITNDQVSMESNAPGDLPESTSLSSTLMKPKIYVKSNEELFSSGV